MKLRNTLVAGAISVSVAAGLVSPVYSAQAATLRVDKCSVHVSVG